MAKWVSNTEEGKGYNRLRIKMMKMKMVDKVKNRKMVAASDDNICECIRKLKNQIYH